MNGLLEASRPQIEKIGFKYVDYIALFNNIACSIVLPRGLTKVASKAL